MVVGGVGGSVAATCVKRGGRWQRERGYGSSKCAIMAMMVAAGTPKKAAMVAAGAPIKGGGSSSRHADKIGGGSGSKGHDVKAVAVMGRVVIRL